MLNDKQGFGKSAAQMPNHQILGGLIINPSLTLAIVPFTQGWAAPPARTMLMATPLALLTNTATAGLPPNTVVDLTTTLVLRQWNCASGRKALPSVAMLSSSITT